MRNYLFLSGFLSLLAFDIKSQNLVPNPGFETQNTCPSNNIFTAADWFNPNTASPDYFHPCGTGSTVPPNVLFGPQAPRTGNSFAGAGWYGLGGGWYDYVQVQLTSPLTAGAVYSVSMWVSLADGVKRASDDIGIYISATPFKSTATGLPAGYSVAPTVPASFGVFSFTPQIKCADNNFITDAINWTLVSGTYVATGGEQAITIGCFEAWATTGTSIVNAAGNDRCYYFIDDVSVELMTPVIPSQPLAIAGATSVCGASQQIYSVSPVGGATSYSWILSSGWTGTSATNTIAVTTTTNNGTITVTATNTLGTSPAQTLAVNAVNFQASATQVNSTLQTTVAGTYQWVDCNNSYSVLATGSNTFAPSTSGNYAVIISQNGCVQTSPCLSITIAPLQPGFIAGSATLCANASAIYSITPVAGSTSYSWNLPAGWSGTSTTNTISVTANAANGIISVSAVNAGGASVSQTLAVNINSFQATVLQVNGSLQTTVTGTYQWIDCNNNFSVIATGSATFTPSQNGSYALIIDQNGCTGTSACLNFYVLPAQPLSIDGPVTLCANAIDVYSVAPVANATSYSWTLPPGWSGTSVTNAIAVTTNSLSGTLSVTANNPAGQSPVQFINVSVNTVAAVITQTANVLHANTATSYKWLDCDHNYAVVSTAGNTFTPAHSGAYAVAVSQNGCVDTSACVIVNLTATGISEKIEDTEFAVFPNPADDLISVVFKKSGHSAVIFIHDYTGHTIYKGEAGINASVSEIPVNNLASGIYFISVIYPGKTAISKKITIVR